ncbi:type II toxin-antitoxin system RelE/ParE family toxin [Amaricoccus sp.]|uniref:type II toxin-antitoxin system RelE/ParE family toxin n=1 Tax=Amaricoccus sp. TaxID=1872485 RepID=UPI001B758161|nr:type II toxin-antitoxin system RelE/ParE family toxin [Amaricoccus sp.]MBP7001040.1 type II toxin-antitoxin system RelE/ParE family toxin [Amaricoccus sp.]
MRIFKTKWFGRFARQEKIADATLVEAISRAERGVIDADLGHGVIKQRIARPGQGTSGGFRSIILFRRESRAYFVYGFAKSDRGNIRKDELEAFRKLASELLDLDDAAIEAAMANETIMEVKHD